MIKYDELIDPNSCLNKAQANEPLFVLLGRDPAAADTIRFWINKRVELGKNQPDDAQILEALGLAMAIEGYQSRRFSSLPGIVNSNDPSLMSFPVNTGNPAYRDPHVEPDQAPYQREDYCDSNSSDFSSSCD